jgi:hypothetical protein
MSSAANKVFSGLKEAGLLLALVLLLPAVIIVIGTPIVLLVRLVIGLTN